jgi:hypothetical protein
MGGCFPGAQDTGIPPGVALTRYTGPCTITVANTVIDAKRIGCDLDIRTTGVVIRRSLMTGEVGIQEGSSLRVEDSWLDGGQCSDCGFAGFNFTLIRVEVTGTNRAAYCIRTCLIQDSWIHGQNVPDQAHASGIRVEQYATLVHNSIACDWTDVFGETGCSADITGYPDFAPIHHNTVDRNLLVANPTGLSFCAYGGGTAGKPYSGDPANATYVVFRNNVFQRGSNGKCGAYGAVTDFYCRRAGNVWHNNRWDSGELVGGDEDTGTTSCGI